MGKYDYSLVKVDYPATLPSSLDSLRIICSLHGEFTISYGSHKKGHGCQKCGNVYRKSTDEFIQEAMLLHGDKYDYSKTQYVNAYQLVTIICKKHGEFKQSPSSHLSGRKCGLCSGRKLTTKEFIKKAIVIHGNKFNYSKVVFVKSNTHILIICPKHGIFKQTPNKHLNGRGCKKCGLILRSEKRVKYTKDMCIIAGKKYLLKNAWRNSLDFATYDAAKRNGWMNECSKHMKNHP